MLVLVVGGVIFLVFCVVFLYFVCFHPVSFVPNVARDSGLSILDCPFGFPKRLFSSAIFIEVKPEKNEQSVRGINLA